MNDHTPLPQFAVFISNKFKQTGISINQETVDSVLSITEGHPYLTQQLCHELWNIGRDGKTVKDEDVKKALNLILSQHSDYFSRIWDSLAPSQKKLMIAIAKEIKVQNIYSTIFVKKHSLTSASHVKKALDFLEKEALVDHEAGLYYIEDVFLREWIRVNLCSCTANLSASITNKKKLSTSLD